MTPMSEECFGQQPVPVSELRLQSVLEPTIHVASVGIYYYRLAIERLQNRPALLVVVQILHQTGLAERSGKAAFAYSRYAPQRSL